MEGSPMRKSIKMIAVTGAAVLGISAVGVGWAYYTESATANAVDGKSADMKALTINDAPTYVYDNADGLYPGHSASVTIVVTNPNKVAVTVTKVTNTEETVTAVDQSNNSYCKNQLDVAVEPTFTGNGGGNGLVVPAEGAITLTLTDAISLPANTTNKCQGMDFDLKYDVESANN
jgi:hypothetical protein